MASVDTPHVGVGILFPSLSCVHVSIPLAIGMSSVAWRKNRCRSSFSFSSFLPLYYGDLLFRCIQCPVCRGGHFDDAVVRFLSSSLGEWLAYLELKRAHQGLLASPLSQQLLREGRARLGEGGGEENEAEENSPSSSSSPISTTSASRDLLLLLLPREHLQIQRQRQQEMLEDDVLIHGFRRCPGCGIAIQRVGSLDDVLCRYKQKFVRFLLVATYLALASPHVSVAQGFLMSSTSSFRLLLHRIIE